MSAVTDRQIRESDKLLAALARHVGDMAFAQAHLDAHQPLNTALRAARENHDQIQTQWKAAIQMRDALVDEDMNLYLDIEADLVDHFGTGAADLDAFLWRGATTLDTPAELLSVLEKMQAAFAEYADLPFAADYTAELPGAITALGEAIQEAERLENAVRESSRARLAVEDEYRQARAKTRRRLVRYFKAGRHPAQLDEFLGG